MTALLKNRCLGRCVALLVACLLLSGCGGGGVSKANFDKINNGMSLQEVEGLLGKGTEVAAVDAKKFPGVGGALKMPEMKMPGVPDVKMPDMPGMPGMPAGDLTSAKWVKWGSENKYILIGFIGDKVMIKLQQGL